MVLIANLVIAQKVVRYDLHVQESLVNFTGKEKKGFTVNNQFPMPTLTFTEGDSAVIYVHNELDEATSFHWHGLLVPNEQDGVPYLTSAPVQPGETHLYTFKIRQNGTYWSHSHAGLQEQSGLYGNLIIHKKKDDKTIREYDTIPDYAMVLSEWTDEKPFEVHRKLHNGSDWYAIKKNTTQSYLEAIKAGHFKTKLTNEWKRMLAMDVSDVYYDKFLINGKDEKQVSEINGKKLKAGDKIRLRIANGGASSYFWLNYAGGKMIVVASDGMDVEPVEVDRLIIGTSETYDVVITIPYDETAFEFIATPEDRTSSTSIYFGNGIKQLHSNLPKLKYFEGMKMMNDMMKLNGNMDPMGMNMSLQQMDMNTVMYPEISGELVSKKEKRKNKKNNVSKEMDHPNHNMNMDGEMDMGMSNNEIVTLNYAMLKSPIKTTLPINAPTRTLYFELTGNMNRYVWTLDGKTISEADKILIKKGENIRIVINNNSMMRHPMHLHGHFFRVINGQGDYAPLKNVLDILPMETDTIEFNAAEEYGDWFFHCHILYHMMSGMGRVFSYEDSPPNSQLPNKEKAYKKVKKEDKKFHFMIENDFASNGNDGKAMLQNTRWNFETEWRLGYGNKHGYEIETHFGRYFGKIQEWFPYVGVDWRFREDGIDFRENNLFGQINSKDKRTIAHFGFQYTLPLLIVADARVDTDGKFRLQLMREDIPLAKRLRANFMVNSDKEYMLGLKYILTKFLALSTHYDSDMGLGAGFTLNY